MKVHSTHNNRETANPTPRRLIIVVTSILSLGLLASVLFTFITLSRLRTDYLSNRGHQIAFALDVQVRGPDRRHNPAFWQSVFETYYETYSASVAFLSLIDQNGNSLARAGRAPTGHSETPGTTDGDVYFFEEVLSPPRASLGNPNHSAAGWRIRIGLDTTDANFIQRMAFLQLIVSGMAIAALIVLSIYLIRMLNRFLAMKAREAEEAQLRSLGIMAASLAHEIRNPLGAMKGLTQLALEDLPSDHAAQPQLKTVVSEAERLEKLVTDLLDFARTKEPDISEFNLADILSGIKAMLDSRLEASQVALRLSIEPNPFPVKSDAAGLRQIFLNVLINAIDATPANGEVHLTAMQHADRKSVLIRIDDTGEGLGEGDPEELLQPFVTTKTRGTGLGLAISKQIVESLGGSLNLENLPQHGARCSIMLPMR
jgi:signal transduction histidine kinase